MFEFLLGKKNEGMEDVNLIKKIRRESNKIIRKYTCNTLVRDFIHEVDSELSQERPRSFREYVIDTSKYSDKDIFNFLFPFMADFNIHMYEPFNIFVVEDNFIRIDFKVRSGSDTKVIKWCTKAAA